MLKQIWIAECDLCGKTEEAKIIPGRYNEREVVIPKGWSNAHNKEFILCPECLAARRANTAK